MEIKDRVFIVTTASSGIAQQTGRGMPQVALAWLRQQPAPVIPILGARKVSQLQDNLASLEFKLSAEQVKSLDDASSIEPGFPYYLYNAQMSRALAYGGMRDSIIT
jgi:aryl-alcohol dehydrogenase-like predicted oxidoreductase